MGLHSVYKRDHNHQIERIHCIRDWKMKIPRFEPWSAVYEERALPTALTHQKYRHILWFTRSPKKCCAHFEHFSDSHWIRFFPDPIFLCHCTILRQSHTWWFSHEKLFKINFRDVKKDKRGSLRFEIWDLKGILFHQTHKVFIYGTIKHKIK